jgi:hypothetical protein
MCCAVYYTISHTDSPNQLCVYGVEGYVEVIGESADGDPDVIGAWAPL